MSRLNSLRTRIAADEPRTEKFTLHVDFLAKGREQAMLRAALYVDSLNTWWPEVDSFRARISAVSDRSTSVPLYCNAPGPDPMDVCLSLFAHKGLHHGPGASGTWVDADIPAAPDDIGDLASADGTDDAEHTDDQPRRSGS